VMRDLAAGGRLRQEGQGLTPQEVDAIRKRLRALGYMD